jgi:toxin ParE1/3/4
VTWRVLIRAAAEQDLEEARKWYNGQRGGLGDEFLVSIAEAFTRLEQDPERYRVLYKGFRRVLVERFPYKILYRLRAKDVIVFRVLHHARDYPAQL